MKDRESIQAFVDSFKQNPDSIVKFLGKCLEDMWLSGEFRLAGMSGEFRGSAELARTPEGLGIVIIRGDRLQLGVVPVGEWTDRVARDQGKNLDAVVSLMWNDRAPALRRIANSEKVHDMAVMMAEERDLSTLAGVQISRSHQTGNRLIEVLHPKFFLEVARAEDPQLNGAILNEAALTIALHFLSSGSFESAQRTFNH